MEDYDDLLKVADVTEVIGYSSASVHLWCKNKKLQAFRVSGKFLIPKSCFLDFIVLESCFDIKRKTDEQMKLIERKVYLDKMINVIGTPDIKVITGVR